MRLEAVGATLPSRKDDADDSVHHHIAQALRAARENLTEARRFVRGLGPAALQREALPEAIAALAARWGEDAGVMVEVITTGAPCEIGPASNSILLRAAQEALANVRKHAGARRVTLTLSYMDDAVMLDVQDNGRGFDPAQAPCHSRTYEGGFGLAALRERVERLGGTVALPRASRGCSPTDTGGGVARA